MAFLAAGILGAAIVADLLDELSLRVMNLLQLVALLALVAERVLILRRDVRSDREATATRASRSRRPPST